MQNASYSEFSVLDQNCRMNWPQWTCTLFNISGLISTGIWFVVLFPQVVKNWRRKSVHGLSILWATANFTASLVNLLFVFKLAEMALYVKVSAIYMPILEMVILLQFFQFDNEHKTRAKVLYSGLCLSLWASVLAVQSVFQIADKLLWISIVLWSVETIPQVFLNMRLHSTSGQAHQSVILAITGKMTDFLSTYGLVMPLQYVIMCYFSSTTAYVNGLQLILYWNSSEGGPAWLPSDCRKSVKVIVGVYLVCALLFFAVGIVWNTASLWALFAPGSMGLVFGLGYWIISRNSNTYDELTTID